MDYVSREIEGRLRRALESLPVVVLTGMRQVGKTTLIQEAQTFRGRRYIDLDDFAQREAALRDPEALLSGDEPITIDEAQRAPALLPLIKRLVDQRRTPGRFLLSGSANFALLEKISESLAGRAVYLTLEPFTYREIRKNTSSPPFVVRFFERLNLPDTSSPRFSLEVVLTGGMPPVCLGQVQDHRLWFQGFEQTYLERDLRQLAQVADLMAFRRLLGLVAYRTAQVLNISDLARDAGLSVATASRYLGLLEASFVVRKIPPYLGGRAMRLIKSPKIYLADSGLAAYLTQTERLEALAQSPLKGALLETWVAQNLAALLEAHWPRAHLCFWHVQGRHEVDFVIDAGTSCLAIEVKAYPRWTEQDLRGLRAFLDRTPHCRAALLAHTGEQAVSLGDRLWAVPLSLLLA